jgi:hypothetical protein
LELDPIKRWPDITFPIEAACNPCLSTMPSGKRYAIGGNVWLEVPPDAKFEELPKWMVYNPRKPSYDEVKVEGSKGNIYTVRKDSETGKITCTCPAHKYRGKCKHAKIAFGE